mmetsp:Transcript_98131/g.219594  ORF Transcript_98131/g.219594 Transcript_98131/m.219594 type:complete len:103 (+) Transcript_98131:887-1195(+)
MQEEADKQEDYEGQVKVNRDIKVQEQGQGKKKSQRKGAKSSSEKEEKEAAEKDLSPGVWRAQSRRRMRRGLGPRRQRPLRRNGQDVLPHTLKRPALPSPIFL